MLDRGRRGPVIDLGTVVVMVVVVPMRTMPVIRSVLGGAVVLVFNRSCSGRSTSPVGGTVPRQVRHRPCHRTVAPESNGSDGHVGDSPRDRRWRDRIGPRDIHWSTPPIHDISAHGYKYFLYTLSDLFSTMMLVIMLQSSGREAGRVALISIALGRLAVWRRIAWVSNGTPTGRTRSRGAIVTEFL